jgi:hypothetical protein
MSHTIDAPGSGSGDALTSVGAGTLNNIPLWTPDGSTLGDSKLTQSGNKIIAQGDLTYDVTEGIWFGDGDSGIYESADDTLNLVGDSTVNIQIRSGSISTLKAINHSGGAITISGSNSLAWGGAATLDGYTLPTTSRPQQLPDVAGDVAVYSDTFASGTIPLLGDGAGTGVTGEISNSNLVQAAGGDLTFTGGGLAIDSGETIGVSSTTTTPGSITYYSDFGGRIFLYSGGGSFEMASVADFNGITMRTKNIGGQEAYFNQSGDAGAYVTFGGDTSTVNIKADAALASRTQNFADTDGTLAVWGEATYSGTEALTVDNGTKSSGALTANTTYEVTSAGSGSDFSNGSGIVNDTSSATLGSQADTLGTIIKVGTSFTPTDYGGAVLTPVLPIYGNAIEITSDDATATNRTRNFPANSGVDGQEITVYLSGGSNQAEIEGETLDGSGNNVATFIRIGGTWLTKVAPHAG